MMESWEPIQTSSWISPSMQVYTETWWACVSVWTASEPKISPITPLHCLVTVQMFPPSKLLPTLPTMQFHHHSVKHLGSLTSRDSPTWMQSCSMDQLDASKTTTLPPSRPTHSLGYISFPEPLQVSWPGKRCPLNWRKAAINGKTGTGELWVAPPTDKRNIELWNLIFEPLFLIFVGLKHADITSKKWDCKTPCLWSGCVLYLSSLNSPKKHKSLYLHTQKTAWSSECGRLVTLTAMWQK